MAKGRQEGSSRQLQVAVVIQPRRTPRERYAQGWRDSIQHPVPLTSRCPAYNVRENQEGTQLAIQPDIKDIVSINPRVMSGTPVFRDTRVPVQTLLDHLEAGDSLETFLDDFPTVTRKQAVRFLEIAGDAVLTGLDADPA